MSESFSTFLHSATPNYSCLNSLLASKLTAIPSIPQPYCSICTHCNHLLTNFNHHPPGNAAEEGTSKLGTGLNVKSHQQSSSSSSTRWSPTPIQLLVLEELYRQGTKTPSAEQIQQIASQLRQFGKIEGKNVFYWFQNHKARERQKRRRREMEEDNTTTAPPPSSTQGLKETGCEVKETKKWASTSNCSGHAEESAALDRAEKGSNGWTTQFEEIRGIQALRRSNNMHHHHHANKCQHMEIAPFPSIAIASPPTSVASHRTSNKHLLGTPQNYILSSVLNRESFINYDDDEENADPRTLELFPVKSSDGICFSERKSNYNKFCANGASMEDISCNQFFEFLPLRN